MFCFLRDDKQISLRTQAHTHLHVLYKFTRRYFCTHTEAVSSCSYGTLITCKHQGYVHVVGTCVVIGWHCVPRYPGRRGASLWGEPQHGGVLHSSRRPLFRREVSFWTSAWVHSLPLFILFFLSDLLDSASKQDTTAQCCSQYCFIVTVLYNNNNHDSHQVHPSLLSSNPAHQRIEIEIIYNNIPYNFKQKYLPRKLTIEKTNVTKMISAD